jgi:hypothetical protein
MVGKVLFISFLRMNPGLTVRKAENLSHGRLMGFHTEFVDDISTFRGKRWRYEAEPTASFDIEIGWDRT